MNNASDQAFIGKRDSSIYGASKAALAQLTMSSALDWGPKNIRVNCVAPGWIVSSGMDNYSGDFAKFIIPSLAGNVPLKRMGTESEISSAIVYLLSEAAGFVSGMTIRIDGAASLGTRMYPLADATNSVSFNGFHRAFIPDVLKGELGQDVQEEKRTN